MSDAKKLIDGLFTSMFGEEGPERPSDEVGAPILNASPRYYSQGDEEEPGGSPDEVTPKEDDEETDPARNLNHSTLETLVACQWDEIDTLTEKVASLDTKVYELERRLEAWSDTLNHLGVKQRATIQLIKGIRDLLHEAL